MRKSFLKKIAALLIPALLFPGIVLAQNVLNASSTISQYRLLVGNGLFRATGLSFGSSGQVLTSSGVGALPTWQDLSSSPPPDLTYRSLSGTKYYSASSSASDNLAFHFNNGFISSGASSSISDLVKFTNSGTSTFSGGISSAGLASSGGLTISDGGILIGGDYINDLVGTGLQVSGGALTLNATGDWTGTFDGQQGSYYLDRTNHTGSQAASTITGGTFGSGDFVFPSDLTITGNATSTGLGLTGKIYSTFSGTSTFSGGIYANALRTNLPSCDSLDTDSTGAIVCGVDASGGSSAPDLIYRTLSGTKYYTASTSATDNLAFHFNNGFVSSASSSIAGDFRVDGGLYSKGWVVSTSTTIGSDNAQFTGIQTALTANWKGLNIKDGTYSEQLTIANNKTKITGESLNATIQANGVTQTPAIDYNGKTEVRIDNITLNEINALPVGVGLDFSDVSLGRLTFSRVNNFGTSTQFVDAASATFYNLLLGNTLFDCGYACQEYSGTQANANNSAFNRMRPMQTPEQGYGIFLNDTRGFSSFGDDVEGTTTANNVIGIYQGISSRDNNFYGIWDESHTTGVGCATGTVRLGIFGGTVTGNGTDIEADCIGANTLLNVNVSGTTLNTIGTRLGVGTSTSFDASPQHAFGVTGNSLFNGDVDIDASDLVLWGTTADIRSNTDLDVYPGAQTSRALRISDGTSNINLSAIGSVPLRIADNFYITNDLNASSTVHLTGTTTITNLLSLGASTATGDNLFNITAPSGRTFGASVSVGGLFNLNNTNNTGAGVVFYTNAGASSGRLFVLNCDNVLFDQSCQHIAYDGTGDALSIAATDAASNAISATNSGKDHTLSVSYTGVRTNKGAASFSSTASSSTMNVSGNEIGQGTVKVTHTGTGTDGNASGLSIDLAGSGTAAQGIFIDATGGGTTGKLLNLRNNGTEYLNLSSAGSLNLINGGKITVTGTKVSEKYQKSFSVINPGFNDIMLFKAQESMTITDIHCLVDSTDGSGITKQMDVFEAASDGSATTTTDAIITCDSNGAEDDGSLTNGTIDAGDWVGISLRTASGTPSLLTGTIYYTID